MARSVASDWKLRLSLPYPFSLPELFENRVGSTRRSNYNELQFLISRLSCSADHLPLLLAKMWSSDFSGWSDSFAEPDGNSDRGEWSPLPAPSFKTRPLPASPRSDCAKTVEAEDATEVDEDIQAQTSNPFTKAAFNYAVRQTRRRKNATSSSAPAGTAQMPQAQHQPLSLNKSYKRKTGPLNEAFAKQASKALHTLPQPEQQQTISRPSPKRGRANPAQEISPKAPSTLHLSKPSKPKMLSPPVHRKPARQVASSRATCSVETSLPAPRPQKQPSAAAFERTESAQNDGSRGLHAADSPAASPAATSNVSSPPLPSLTLTEIRTSESASDTDPPIDSDAEFAALFSTKPVLPPPMVSSSATGLKAAVSSHRSLTVPCPQGTVTGPSNAPSEAGKWSTLKVPPPPARPYASSAAARKPKIAQSHTPPPSARRFTGSLPGLVPNSSVSGASQTRRLRAFEPPVPLSQWRRDKTHED